MERQTIRRGSTNSIELRRFYDKVDEEYQEGATVKCDLKDAANATISGGTNIAMPEFPGATPRDVIYRGTVLHTLTLPTGNGTALVTASAVSGAVRLFPIPVKYED